jgi:hypothetical protein
LFLIFLIFQNQPKAPAGPSALPAATDHDSKFGGNFATCKQSSLRFADEYAQFVNARKSKKKTGHSSSNPAIQQSSNPAKGFHFHHEYPHKLMLVVNKHLHCIIQNSKATMSPELLTCNYHP